jgi:hypothetical protein
MRTRATPYALRIGSCDFLLVVILTSGLLAHVQSGGPSMLPPWTALRTGAADYDLSWNTVDGGGHTFSTGGDYTLGGTIGQSDAGQMSEGEYTLGGGFWGGGVVTVSHDVYLPLVVRRY